MTHSLATSSVQHYAATAGIPDKKGALAVEEDRFVVTTGSGEYVARFEKNGQPVEQFTSDTLGRHLTREEARDLVVMIKNALPIFQRIQFNDALTRLQDNLPNLGFSQETPLMGVTAQAATPAPVKRNALQWTWALNHE